MRMQFDMERPRTDHILVASVLLLTGLGLVTLYSSSYASAQRLFGDGLYFVSKQILFWIAGGFLFFIASIVNLEWIRKLIKPMVYVALILCLLTFVPGIGISKNGAARWIGYGSISFQPSELVKLVLPLYLAHFFDKKKESIDSIGRGIIPPILICGLFVTVIFLQNNFSTAAFLVINAFFMFYLAGIKFRYFLIALIMFFPIAFLMVLQKEHRVKRFLSFINPDSDPLGATFQVGNSVRAISSGGFWGKGLGQGTEKISSIPEIQSDFIFSAYAEESGFLGVMLFCFLFAVFAARGYIASMRNENTFSRLLGCSLVTMITSQVLMNIAVVAGALPPTGIPLPFFSAGGSSLFFTMVMAGFIVNVSRNTKGKA